MSTSPPLKCHYLLLVATKSERESLERAATELDLPFEQRNGKYANYFDLGVVGISRVFALKTVEGPFGHGGSAAQALLARFETQAVGGIIGVGMCFGVDRERQKLGDIIVSSALVPYDRREVLSDQLLPRFRYKKVERYEAKESLRELFRHEAERASRKDVHVGALLTGGSHIACAAYRDHLVHALTEVAKDRIVGGEMEGAGLLSLSEAKASEWCVVKAICDFADEGRDTDAPASRTEVCYKAARFVLEAIRNEVPAA
jgi:adenosylhomocysteine nucleosidase